MSLSLEIQLDGGGGPYAPGDWVRGRVRVLEGGKSRALKVALHFRESSVDYSATPRTESIAPIHWGELTAGESHEFAIQVPADALPPFSSPHGQLYWELEAKSDELGIDTTAESRIEVVASPAG